MASKAVPKTQIYEGILYKQGNIIKTWKKRFFVLYSDRRLLYFKNKACFEKGKSAISHIDLSLTRSIAATNRDSIKNAMKKGKGRRGSLSRKWSTDGSSIFGNKGNQNEDESDEEDDDKQITFIELVLNKIFTFEIVEAKRTYTFCTDDATKFNKWLNKLEVTTFGKKVYKGWLLQHSERNKKWHKRWFIIYDAKQIRFYDDETRAVSRGMAELNKLKKITKMDDEKAMKKYKQINVLKLEFQKRTLLLSSTPSDDRRIWFDKICRIVGGNAHFVDPIYDDTLYRYDERSISAKWKKFWFLLDRSSLIQFSDMNDCDAYCKNGYFDEKEHNEAFSKYVIDKIMLTSLQRKDIQKIRRHSNLQNKLMKEWIFILHSKELGRMFFATDKENQLNRWFKKIRSLTEDNIYHKLKKKNINKDNDNDIKEKENKYLSSDTESDDKSDTEDDDDDDSEDNEVWRERQRKKRQQQRERDREKRKQRQRRNKINNDNDDDDDDTVSELLDQIEKLKDEIQELREEKEEYMAEMEEFEVMKEEQFKLQETVELQRQQIDEFEEDRKEYEVIIDELKDEIKHLKKKKGLDVNNVQEWDSNDVLNWILSIENGLFVQYKKKLREEIMDGELSGNDLITLNIEDIKALGIGKFTHRKLLQNNIQKLNQINHPKQNQNDLHDEGIDAPTAYI